MRPAARTGLLVGIVCASLVGAVAAPPGQIPSPATLVERVTSAWDPLRVALTARMTVTRPGRPPSQVDLRIYRAGRGKTRIEFLSPPRDQGKILLQLGNETWLYLPRAGRVVAIPARRNPLAGGVLFEDLFPDQPEASGAVVEENDDGWVLVSSSPGSTRKKSVSRITFDRSSLLPFRREVYGPSGRLLKTVHIDETRDWNGVPLPWDVRFVDHVRRGAEARIEIVKADELAPDADELFAKDRLRPTADNTATDEP